MPSGFAAVPVFETEHDGEFRVANFDGGLGAEEYGVYEDALLALVESLVGGCGGWVGGFGRHGGSFFLGCWACVGWLVGVGCGREGVRV